MCREYKPDDVEILYITENFGKQEEKKNGCGALSLSLLQMK